MLEEKSDTINNSLKTLLNNQTNNNNLSLIAIECLKKSNVNGTPEEILNEYNKIYNNLLNNINTNRQKVNFQTVFDDYIICLEDGKKMKMLKRHLRTKYKMSFGEYKDKWGLPYDYPYVCKNYSNKRAKIASKKKKNNSL